MKLTNDHKIIIGFLLLIIIVGGVFFMMPKSSQSIKSGKVQASSKSTSQISPMDNIININNFSFSPKTLTIKQGSTVTWINQDSVAHNIKFDTFTSPSINSGGSFPYVFKEKGTFNYVCGIHPSMTGTIIVN